MGSGKQTVWRRRCLMALLAGIALTLAGCAAESEESEQQEDVAAEVPVRVAEYEPVLVSRTYTGRTHGSREVEVRARVSGILQSRDYTEGALVQQGNALFRIDPTRYEVRAQRAEAELERAGAEVQQAEREWERVSDLYEDDAISGRERDEALSALELARAGEALAEAELAETRIDLDYTTVEASVDGVAGLEEHPEGSLVEAGTLLATLTRLDPIHVRFSLPEAHMTQFGPQIRSGASVRVSLSTPDGQEYPEAGEIDFADAAIDPQTGTVRARAVFPNPERTLMPGQFVRISLSGLHLGWGIAVPHRAVAEGSGGPVVYVLDEDDQPQARRVILGHDLGDEVLLTQGVSDGDRVVVDGVAGLEEGVAVIPVEEEREDEAEDPQVLGVLPPADVDVLPGAGDEDDAGGNGDSPDQEETEAGDAG